MTDDRARMAPEMTPLVDAPDDEAVADDRRGVLGGRTVEDKGQTPGEVPGLSPDTTVEGRSRLGTSSGPDPTDEGEGERRDLPKP